MDSYAAYAALRHIQYQQLSILDLGAGSGASTAGVIYAAKSLNIPVRSLIAIDSSLAQLELFQRITGRWLAETFPDLAVAVERNDAVAFLRSKLDETTTLVVASYLRGEIREKVGDFDRLIARGTLDRDLLLIDQSDSGDGTVFSLNGRDWTPLPTKQLRVHVDRLSDLPLPVPPKGVARRRRSNPCWLPSVIADYFRAWQTHDLGAIRSLFTPNATYEIRSPKGIRTLRGLEAFVDYWRKNARDQRGVKWVVKPSTVNQSEACLDFPWSATFERIDNNLQYALTGRMRLYLAGRRIESLSEQYTIEYGPSRPTTFASSVGQAC